MRLKVKKVIMIGGFHEVIELCKMQGVVVKGIFDNNRIGDYYGCKILGNDDDAIKLIKSFSGLPLIVTPDNPQKRRALVQYYSDAGYHFTSLISKLSTISKSAIISNGAIISSYANISCNVKIENFTRINMMANIMHDVTIGQFATVAPNAVILGNVKIGNGSYIGANSTILPGLIIGNNTIIGAGAVVTKNVEDGKIMVGNPARELKKG